jgi:hypothetical protein
MDPDLYDPGNVLSLVQRIADDRLSGPYTVELTAWDDGDFQISAFHTVNARAGMDEGDPFHRERVVFSTSEGEAIPATGTVYLQVVRRESQQTGGTVLYETPAAHVAVEDARTPLFMDEDVRRAAYSDVTLVQRDGTLLGVEGATVSVENDLEPCRDDVETAHSVEEVEVEASIGFGEDGSAPECGICNGTGMLTVAPPGQGDTAECPECDGTGTVEEGA